MNKLQLFSFLSILVLIVSLLSLKMGIGLIFGLILFVLTKAIFNKLNYKYKKSLTLIIVLLFIAGISSVANNIFRYVMRLWRNDGENLITYILVALNDLKNIMPKNLKAHIPENKDQLFEHLSPLYEWLGQNILNIGGTSILILFQLLFAFIIGMSIATRINDDSKYIGPLTIEYYKQLEFLKISFSKLMLAQLYVAVWNAFCTSIFIYVILPLADVTLSFREVLVIFTLFISLIPALGNMIANALMALLCLPHGIGVLLSAVVFLILIHKAEYLINAKIIGKDIDSSIPEMLLAILIGERLFGLPGLMLGPVTYAYIKLNLKEFKLV